MLELAVLKTYDEDYHRAGVQLAGSLTTYFDNVNVARNIASGEMITGRHVILAVPQDNPRDAVVIAVFTP